MSLVRLAVVCVLAVIVATGARAAELTLERIFDSPELSGPSIRALRMSPAGDRVTFLRGREDDRNLLDLWEYHLDTGETRRLVAADDIPGFDAALSDAERARRERARIADLRGIVEYRFSADGRFLLFPLGGDIHLLDLTEMDSDDEDGTAEAPESPVRQLTSDDAFDTDPAVAPDGNHVAFVRDRDLWVVEVASGEAKRLTESGHEAVASGVAEFIAQEEMGRDTGYWWSPDGSRIAFLEIDERPIEPSLRFEITGRTIHMVEQRYPYAGTANVHYRLGVVTVADGAVTWIDIGNEPDIYIPRLQWHSDGESLFFQRQSRDQKRLELVRADAGGDSTRTVLTDTSETWINLHDDLHFLERMDAFVWSSERDGYRHLYLHGMGGNEIRRLTQGEWAVDSLAGVDEELGMVYFTAAADSPTEKHLYRQSLVTSSPEVITRITRRTGWHEITMDRDARIYIDGYSSYDQPPQVSLHSADGERKAWLVENRLGPEHPYYPYRNGHRSAQFGTLVGPDGQDLHYRLIRPADFDPERRYPVLVHVYGGPTHRLVTNQWGRRHLVEQYFARRGYAVFSLDNRGIERQGVEFQAPAYRNLGRVEIADQIIGVDFLTSQEFVDPERIGIFGWSYGGYMALMALMQHPGTFAAGVAVAPVTDWALYDTHYTERYLGMPLDEDGRVSEPYERANVLTYADALTDPLMLIHPMADDNVLFTHSTRLMQHLQERSIPFELMTYPGEKHAIAGEGQRLHVYRTIDAFLQRTLKPSDREVEGADAQ